MGGSNSIAESARASLYGMFIGDAISMPVHWFYEPEDIKTYFPPAGIQKYEPAPEKHPSYFCVLQPVKQAEQSSNEGQAVAPQIVVGQVILKGKEKFYNVPNVHVHQGLKAGENTLNVQCARLVLRSVIKLGKYDADSFLNDYVAFMTSEVPLHNDTYAEKFHRNFFHNLVFEKRSLQDSAESIPDSDEIGALVMTAAATIAEYLLTQSAEKAVAAAERQLRLHHRTQRVGEVTRAYAQLLVNLIEKGSGDAQKGRDFIVQAGKDTGVDVQSIFEKAKGDDAKILGGQYDLSCPLGDSWPSVLYLAYRYVPDGQEGLRKALLQNTNLGGDSVNRGSVLGSILGAALATVPQDLIDGLYEREAETKEIEDLLKLAKL